MSSLYHLTEHYIQDELEVLNELRDKIAKVAGVTLVGNRLTIRWYKDGQFVDVHMLIEGVRTVDEAKNQGEADKFHKRFEQILKNHPKAAKAYEDLQFELFRLEHGEYPE
jgi:GrpB-like predicted nucleotidyltransferase (UPF0157 family)